MKKKLDPDVFVTAAQLIDCGAFDYSCCAVSRAENELLGLNLATDGPGPGPGPHRKAYERHIVRPGQRETGFSVPFSIWSEEGLYDVYSPAEHRVFALLMFAEFIRRP